MSFEAPSVTATSSSRRDTRVILATELVADDHAWVLYTDYDAWSTKISGSKDLIRAIADDPELETLSPSPLIRCHLAGADEDYAGQRERAAMPGASCRSLMPRHAGVPEDVVLCYLENTASLIRPENVAALNGGG